MWKTKLPALLLALMLCMTLLAAPASAYSGEGDALPNNVNTSWADDESDEETGGVEVTETGKIVEYLPSSKPLTPEGNLTLVDDINDSSGRSKQFLTVTTRGGNYFYLIVDRAKNGENTVHFLNQVDESDLLAIIGSEEKAPAVCSCSDKCYPGHVDTSCPVCAVNMSECAGKQPEQPETPEQPSEPEQPQSKSPINPVPTVIALVVVVVGGAVYFLKYRNPKPDAKGSADLDEYDYGDEDEDEESEDAEE